jgi:hypothetical protein
MSLNPIDTFSTQQNTKKESLTFTKEIVFDLPKIAEKIALAGGAASSGSGSASGSSVFQVSDLKKELTQGTKIYRLLPNGERVGVEDHEYLTSSEIFLEGNEENVVPCTHRFLEQHWQPSDYEFVFSKGFCSYVMSEYDCVMVQRGLLRFGCPSGFSFDALQHMVSFPSTVLQIDIEVKCQPDFPDEKPADHHVHYGIETLRAMHLDKGPKICPGEISPSSLSQQDVQPILAKLTEFQPLIEESERQQSRPYFCRDCHGYLPGDKELVDCMNRMREEGQPIFACPGCLSMYSWAKRCSMILCSRKSLDAPGCISGTKTCAYCVQGNTGLSHELALCSAKIAECASKKLPLPMLTLCTCPRQATSGASGAAAGK